MRGGILKFFLCSIHLRDGYRLVGTCHSPIRNKIAASPNLLYSSLGCGFFFLLFTGTLKTCPLLSTCLRRLWLTLNYTTAFWKENCGVSERVRVAVAEVMRELFYVADPNRRYFLNEPLLFKFVHNTDVYGIWLPYTPMHSCKPFW